MAVWIIVGLFLLQLMQHRMIKGWLGEMWVNRGLRQLAPLRYQVFHDLYLPRPDGKGTTQIDHVVISPHGIFVIETKNMRGWIFGNENERQWTQSIYRKKSRFQNPLHQNELHVKALELTLGLPRSSFHNIVFFFGDCTFKTKLPSHVMNRNLIGFIKGKQEQLLKEAEWRRARDILQTIDKNTPKRQASKAHRESIQQRLTNPKVTLVEKTTHEHALSTQAPEAISNSAPICPKCQSSMVLRTSKRGEHSGNQFWGCSSYPKCRQKMAFGI